MPTRADDIVEQFWVTIPAACTIGYRRGVHVSSQGSGLHRICCDGILTYCMRMQLVERSRVGILFVT